jgi:hypothetical protein
VSFTAPFLLPELDQPCPAGIYNVETDEEIVEGNERTAYLRVATLLYVRRGATTQVVTVDPKGLEAALALDAKLTP